MLKWFLGDSSLKLNSSINSNVSLQRKSAVSLNLIFKYITQTAFSRTYVIGTDTTLTPQIIPLYTDPVCLYWHPYVLPRNATLVGHIKANLREDETELRQITRTLFAEASPLLLFSLYFPFALSVCTGTNSLDKAPIWNSSVAWWEHSGWRRVCVCVCTREWVCVCRCRLQPSDTQRGPERNVSCQRTLSSSICFWVSGPPSPLIMCGSRRMTKLIHAQIIDQWFNRWLHILMNPNLWSG